MRLQKYIAMCGVCSRRKAEELIAAGRVTVNGSVASLGDSAGETDVVALDGRLLELPGQFTYIMLHKPVGYVTTMDDPEGRPTVAELIKDTGKRLFPVGRLDVMSEGLLLMTDDGETANRLSHPSHGVKKTYLVSVRGEEAAGKAALLSGADHRRGKKPGGPEHVRRRRAAGGTPHPHQTGRALPRRSAGRKMAAAYGQRDALAAISAMKHSFLKA